MIVMIDEIPMFETENQIVRIKTRMGLLELLLFSGVKPEKKPISRAKKCLGKVERNKYIIL